MPARASTPSRSSAPPPGRAAPAFALRPWQAALALGAVHLLVTALVFDPAPHSGGDNAAYLGLARSLMERGDYVELWDPAMRPHTQYPPGFPAILAGAMLLGVRPWAGFKLLVAAFSVAAVALAYLWARRVAGPRVAIATGAILAVGPGLAIQSQLELSDVPFWAFTMLALWAFARAEGAGEAPEAEPGGTADLRWIAVGAAAVAAAALTRSAGLPLVLAVAGWLALRRRWRALGLFAAIALPGMIGWMAWQRSVGGGRSYGTSFWYVDPYQPELGRAGAADLVSRAGENAWKYASEHLPSLALGRGDEPLGIAFGVAVTALALYGWGRRLRRPGVPELFLPLYGGLVLLWPSEWADDRFLLPLLPLLLVYAGETLGALAARTPRPRLAAAGVVALAVVVSLPPLAKRAKRASECRMEFELGEPYACHPPMWGGTYALAERLQRQLPRGSVVLTRKPTLFWAISGYRSRSFPYSPDTDTLLRAAREAGARFLVFDQSGETARYMLPAVRGRREAFCMVPGARNNFSALVRIGTDGPPMPPDILPQNFRVCEPGPYKR